MDKTLILDISSDDDEVGFDYSSTADNFDWISKLFDDTPLENDVNLFSFGDNGDDDDVVVVGETIPNSKKAKVSLNKCVLNDDGDDDDCVVLDCDPDKKDKMEINNGGGDGGSDDDELVVVGEKGQGKNHIVDREVRIFRPDISDEIWANYQMLSNVLALAESVRTTFRSSQSVVAYGHIAMTCTVLKKLIICNFPAFIMLWGCFQVACRDYPHSRHLCAKFPFNSTPHESRCDLCHCYVCDSLAPCAYWGFGVGDHCHASDKEVYWQLERKKVRQSKNGPTPITKAPRLPQNSAQAHQATRTPSTSGVSSSFGQPTIINQGRTQRPTITMSRTRFQPHLVSHQLVRTCNSSIQSNRGSTLASMRPVFKRCGYLNPDPLKHLRQEVSSQANSNVSTCQTNAISTNGLSSQLPAFSQPSHTPMSLSGFQGCGIPSAVTSDNLYVSASVNQTPDVSIPTILQYSSDALNCDMPSSQHPFTVTNDSLYVSTSVNQSQNVSKPTIPQYSSYASNCHTQSNQQPSVVISNVTGLTSHGRPSNVPNYIAGSTQQPSNTTHNLSGPSVTCQEPSVQSSSFQGAIHQRFKDCLQVEGTLPLHDLSSPNGQNLPLSCNTSSSPLDLDIESWLSDNEPVIGTQDGSYFQSAVTAPVDTGMLYFDFETSWKNLTHS